MAGSLEGRRIVVTGSSEGIGRAIALHLASEGACVVVNASGQGAGGEAAATRRLGELVDMLLQAGGDGRACVASVAEWGGAQSIVGTAVDAWGGLDGLVNCAGIAGRPENSLLEIELQDWRRVVGVHLDGTFHGCRAAIPHLRRATDAAIVNTSSHGHLGGYGGSAYPAAKGAINSLTFALATELAPDGIRVNAVCPGAKTRISAGPDYEAQIAGLVDRGLMSEQEAAANLDPPPPEGCAPMYGYLLSGRSAGITGRLFSAAGPYAGLFAPANEQMVGFRTAEEGDWTIDALDDAVRRVLAEEMS